MDRPYKLDTMQLQRHYSWPEDREREKREKKREKAERTRQPFRMRFSWPPRYHFLGVPRTREELKSLRNTKEDKGVSEDDDSEVLLDCTREEWVSSVMRNCIRNQHVFKADSDIITETSLEEDKISDEKVFISTPPSSIKEEDEEECSEKDRHMKAAEPQYNKDTDEELCFKNENTGSESIIYIFSRVLQEKEEEGSVQDYGIETAEAMPELSLDNWIGNMSYQHASRKRKRRLDEDSGRERKRQLIC